MSVRLLIELRGKCDTSANPAPSDPWLITQGCVGTRQPVTVTPMESLRAVLEKYCLHTQGLDASRCELFYHKKKLDLSTPVRFANLPKDAKLELVTGTGRQVFLRERQELTCMSSC